MCLKSECLHAGGILQATETSIAQGWQKYVFIKNLKIWKSFKFIFEGYF